MAGADDGAAERLDLEIRDPRYLSVLWLADFFFDPRREKFFLLHWTDDPHAAYRPPASFEERFAGRLYDGEIAYVDQQIGRIFQALRTSGEWDRTLVIASR